MPGKSGWPNDSTVFINKRAFGPGHKKIKRWTDTKIKIKLPDYKCEWFNGRNWRKRKIAVAVDTGTVVLDSNDKRVRVARPDGCP